MTNFSLPALLDRILEEARLKIAIAQNHLEALNSFGISQDWLDQFQADINTKEWGRQLKLKMTLATTDKKLKGVEFPSKTWQDCQQNESKLITFFPL